MKREVECPKCGKPYVQKRPDHRFCSTTCRGRYWAEFKQTPHPVMPEVARDNPQFEELVLERESWIRRERLDPYNHGYTPDHWLLADEVARKEGLNELMISGGNRAGKTHWAARTVTRLMTATSGMNVLCCHTSHSTSVTVQQPAVYNWLPLALRVTKKGKVHYLNYSYKNGFTDSSFVLPNASRCDFLNYTQSDAVLEGREIDLIWCDELVPQAWIDTLRFRLITRRGLLIVTQTPIEGTATVWRDFTAGGKIRQWGNAPLLGNRRAYPEWPAGKTPRVLQGRRQGSWTVFFYTSDNPYSPYDELLSRIDQAPVPTILTRAYGWATEQAGRAFPRFNPLVHMLPLEKIPTGGSLYQFIDPAGARNYFCIWVRVYEGGRAIVVREFPDQLGYGEWVLPSDKPDGKPGPAQTASAGRSVGGYRQLWREIETELPGRPSGLRANEPEPVVVRYIDPLAGGTPALSEEGGTTLIDLFAMEGETGFKMADEPVGLVPAPKVLPDMRIGEVNNLLSYNAQEPLTPVNEPKLYIAETCANLAYVLAEYTGQDGMKGAGKDPADCVGMFACSPTEYVGGRGLEVVGGGSY